MIEERKNMKYYVVKTQNNREKSVAERIVKESETGTLIGKIGKVIVPLEKVITVKDGKKIQKDKIMLPGYVFLETNSVGEVKYFLRSVKGNSGLLSSRNGEIESLTEAEVNKMIGKQDESKIISDAIFNIGEEVLITDGPFSSMKAIIDEITDKKVKLSVSIFGRKTPLVLDTNQIDKK